MGKNKSRSAIKCRATRRHLRNGTETGDLQGIRVRLHRIPLQLLLLSGMA